MTAEQQGTRLQKKNKNKQANKTQLKCISRRHGNKQATYLQNTSAMQESPEKSPCLHCQPLNEVWEGVDPGSTPSGHSAALHTPELPWVGPAFSTGVPSLLQAMTCISATVSYYHIIIFKTLSFKYYLPHKPVPLQCKGFHTSPRLLELLAMHIPH